MKTRLPRTNSVTSRSPGKKTADEASSCRCIAIPADGDSDTTPASWFITGLRPFKTDENIPAVWTEVTKDLFEDWGAFGVSGMAFTAWDGNGGWWDAVYFHTDPTPPTSVEPQGKLASSWAELKAGR